ncbi:MAG: glycoside hydrolase family 25 protein, partial [Bacilli bacterium]|nr:glycoside hydrolase family 25 protein [Bacilli bacterium]
EVREIKETVKGIDVSSFQGDINWEKVKDSGIDFVMIRCGYRNLSNEEIHEDSKFRYNISEANRVGIKAGVYFYSTAINQKEALEEASFVLNLIKDYDITFPVVYDFEMFNQKRTTGINDKWINDNAVRFLDYIRSHGYIGMLYSNLNAINYHWNLDNFFGYKLWYAQYIDKVTYEGKYDMWQYADNGRVDGIVGNVDLNESYFTYEVINRN